MFGLTTSVRCSAGNPTSAGRIFLPPRWRSVLILGALFLANVTCGAERAFSIPGGDAVRTLQLFSQQSGEQILYPVSEVSGFRTNLVQGTFTPRKALDQMLAESGLIAVQDQASGAVVIKRAGDLKDTDAAQRAAGASAAPRVSRSSHRGATAASAWCCRPAGPIRKGGCASRC